MKSSQEKKGHQQTTAVCIDILAVLALERSFQEGGSSGTGRTVVSSGASHDSFYEDEWSLSLAPVEGDKNKKENLPGKRRCFARRRGSNASTDSLEVSNCSRLVRNGTHGSERKFQPQKVIFDNLAEIGPSQGTHLATSEEYGHGNSSCCDDDDEWFVSLAPLEEIRSRDGRQRSRRQSMARRGSNTSTDSFELADCPRHNRTREQRLHQEMGAAETCTKETNGKASPSQQQTFIPMPRRLSLSNAAA